MRSPQRRDEQGSASIQLVILLPALFAIMFLGMQAALYYHARTLAIAAAEEGARAAAAQGAQANDGTSAATAFITSAGGSSVLEHPTTTVTRTTTTADVTVRGQAMSVIPGWNITITQSASATVERTTQP